ncbi:Mitochondrial distribution and morphology protein 35, partial [Nowakowskiella sp. JEL0407]
MASISPACTELKKNYDTCFNKWYSEKFLKGVLHQDCDALFKSYQKCVMAAIKEKNVDILIADAQKDINLMETPLNR